MFAFNDDFVLKSLHSRRLILFLILIQISRIVIFITATVVTLTKQKTSDYERVTQKLTQTSNNNFFCVLLSQLSIILTSSLCMLREYQISNLWNRVRTNFKQFSQTEGENVECLLLVSFYVCCFSNSYCFSLSLWQRADARYVSFRIYLRWPVRIINSVDKTESSCWFFLVLMELFLIQRRKTKTKVIITGNKNKGKYHMVRG